MYIYIYIFFSLVKSESGRSEEVLLNLELLNHNPKVTGFCFS